MWFIMLSQNSSKMVHNIFLELIQRYRVDKVKGSSFELLFIILNIDDADPGAISFTNIVTNRRIIRLLFTEEREFYFTISIVKQTWSVYCSTVFTIFVIVRLSWRPFCIPRFLNRLTWKENIIYPSFLQK